MIQSCIQMCVVFGIFSLSASKNTMPSRECWIRPGRIQCNIEDRGWLAIQFLLSTRELYIKKGTTKKKTTCTMQAMYYSLCFTLSKLMTDLSHELTWHSIKWIIYFQLYVCHPLFAKKILGFHTEQIILTIDSLRLFFSQQNNAYIFISVHICQYLFVIHYNQLYFLTMNM